MQSLTFVENLDAFELALLRALRHYERGAGSDGDCSQ